ncbi:MAG: hypothetical protein CMH31_07030 [Micavibrio sp.]|nr:hypothetical protein [Micavibrio sp.]
MSYSFDFDERTAALQFKTVKSIQSWKTKSYNNTQAKQAIELGFEKHLKATQEETRTAFAPTGDDVVRRDGKEPYAFHDVVDIVNPLHHLPVVGMLYRGITGDEIKPASQIIGGAIFGGPVGAVTGTVNAIAQIQTGKDVATNVLTMAGLSNDKNDPPIYKNDPESRLNAVAKALENNESQTELPGTALAFVNLSETGRGYTKINAAEGRTAGSMIVKRQVATYTKLAQPAQNIPEIDLDAPMPARERITEVSLSAMPSKENI